MGTPGPWRMSSDAGDVEASGAERLIEDCENASRFSAHSSVLGADDAWPDHTDTKPPPVTHKEEPAKTTECCHQNYVVRLISCMVIGAMIMQTNALNEYCVDRLCDDRFSKKCSELPKHDKDSADSDGAMFSTLCFSLPNVLSIFTTVYLAVISDYTGRQRVLVLNTTLSLISTIAVMLCVVFHLPLWTLLPAQVLAGFGGSVGTLLALCFAHTADVTPRTERTTAFSILESTIFLSGAVGSTLGGQLSQLSAYGPFVAVVSCNVIGSLLVLAAFRDRRSSATVGLELPSWRATMAASLKLATSKAEDSARHGLKTSPRFIAFLFAMIYLCIIGVFSLLVSYLKSDKFGMNNHQIGWIVSGQYMCKWAALFLFPVLFRRFSSSHTEVLIIRFGGAVAAVAIAGYALAPNALVVAVVAMVEAMDVIAVPALRSLFSLAVRDDEQGTALSVVANIETLVQMVVPLGLGQLYGRVTHWIPFAVLSGIAVVFCGLTSRVQCVDGHNVANRKRARRSSLMFGGSFVNTIPEGLESPVPNHKETPSVLDEGYADFCNPSSHK